MCGISGIWQNGQSNFSVVNELFAMNRRISHRGPDSEGFVFFREEKSTIVFSDDTRKQDCEGKYTYNPKLNIDSIRENNYELGFGHRRLAIIDLNESGHQPMCDAEEKIWITYNGEIYNYPELREELKFLGHRFKTPSDTEVIINAYLQWGESCVEKFNGMWAFVIYDIRKKRLFGSRDRTGVKPLYYIKNQNCFAFASEIKALRYFKGLKTEINPSAVADWYLYNQIENNAEGFLKNVFELQPSQSFTFDLASGNFNSQNYFSFESKRQSDTIPISYEDAVQKTKELILKSIDIRLRSDVTVGSCLSGGIDSSSIVTAIKHLYPEKNIDVFTASFPGYKDDETEYAKLVAEKTNANWYCTHPNSTELLEDFEDLVFCQDIPIWSTSTYAQFRVMKLAKEKGIKVLLDGQGGDELFAGYPHHLTSYWNEIKQQRGLNYLLTEMKQTESLNHPLIHYAKSKLKRLIYKSENLHRNNREKLLLAQIRQQKTEQQSNAFESLNQHLVADYYGNLLKGYLKCEDRCAMWFSVESRTPFADDIPLATYIHNLPSEFKIRNGVQKSILRDAMRGLVPDPILNRKDKLGYVTPHNQWLKNIIFDLWHSYSKEAKDWFDTTTAEKTINHLFGKNHHLPKSLKIREERALFKILLFSVWKSKLHL